MGRTLRICLHRLPRSNDSNECPLIFIPRKAASFFFEYVLFRRKRKNSDFDRSLNNLSTVKIYYNTHICIKLKYAIIFPLPVHSIFHAIVYTLTRRYEAAFNVRARRLNYQCANCRTKTFGSCNWCNEFFHFQIFAHNAKNSRYRTWSTQE